MIGYRAPLAALALVALAAAAPPAAAVIPPPPPQGVVVQVVDVVTNGTSVRYLLYTPALTRPSVGVVLFVGGNGLLNITYDGNIGNTDLAQNFLARTKLLFAQKTLAVALVDAPGAVALTSAERTSANHAATMTGVIADFRARMGLSKVSVVGTSSGTLSAANIASRYPRLTWIIAGSKANAGRPESIVFTSALTVRHPSSVSAENCPLSVLDDVALAPINVPAHLVEATGDSCPCSPYADGAGNAGAFTTALFNALTHSPFKDTTFPTGPASTQNPRPNACTALTEHGFLNIEGDVVTGIADWVKMH